MCLTRPCGPPLRAPTAGWPCPVTRRPSCLPPWGRGSMNGRPSEWPWPAAQCQSCLAGVAGHDRCMMSLMDGTIPEPMGKPPCPGLGWAKQIWGIDCSGSGPNSHFISILLSKDKGIPGTAHRCRISAYADFHGESKCPCGMACMPFPGPSMMLREGQD